MNRYVYRDQMLTVNELSEMSGIKPHSLRDRLRRGYSVEQAVKPTLVHDSVEQFCEASHWKDWVNKSTSEVYSIYWKWSVNNSFRPVTIQCFSKHILSMYPQLKVVPIRLYDKCYRMIRLREV